MITNRFFRRGRNWIAALLLALGLSTAALATPYVMVKFAQVTIDSTLLAGPIVDPGGGGG